MCPASCTRPSVSCKICHLATQDTRADRLVKYVSGHGLPDVYQDHPRNMRPSEALNIYRSRIREIALSHRVTGVRVFGSVLRGEDNFNSDLDLLVEPTDQTTLMDIGAIRFELKKLLGFEVDVLTPNALPRRFRDQVLREAVPL